MNADVALICFSILGSVIVIALTIIVLGMEKRR